MHLRINEQFLSIQIPEPLHEYTVTGKNCTHTIPSTVWQQQMIKLRHKTAKRMGLISE